MHGSCLDYPLHKWFDFKIPKTTISSDFIMKALEETGAHTSKDSDKIVWLGNTPDIEIISKSKKGSQWEMCSLTFYSKKETISLFYFVLDKLFLSKPAFSLKVLNLD